ncbi:MAG: thioredoxin [Microcystaceae cyanobacterium]
MGTAAYIQDSEFDALLTYKGPVMVDCTATWCGPCRVVSPLIDQLADEYENRAKVVKLDIDKNKNIARKFDIRSVPAVLIFKGGELVKTIVGVAPYEEFRDAIEQNL